MKRFRGLIRDTWWLWILLFGSGITAAIVVHPIFLTSIAIILFSFIYFGIMRYDANGNPVTDDH